MVSWRGSGWGRCVTSEEVFYWDYDDRFKPRGANLEPLEGILRKTAHGNPLGEIRAQSQPQTISLAKVVY